MNKIAEIKVSYSNKQNERRKVNSSLDIYEMLRSVWSNKTIELQEEFKIVYLNNNNEVLGIYPMSKGGITGTVVDIRLVFSVGLKCNATGIILAHNHPSGNLKPSEGDFTITRKIKKGSELLDIKLLDHLIITKQDYFSFADQGVL